MRETCRVTINGQVFSASCGGILLDAARKDGVDIPCEGRTRENTLSRALDRFSGARHAIVADGRARRGGEP